MAKRPKQFQKNKMTFGNYNKFQDKTMFPGHSKVGEKEDQDNLVEGKFKWKKTFNVGRRQGPKSILQAFSVKCFKMERKVDAVCKVMLV